MKILFRSDAGSKVGLGHFYRSVSLARRLREDGHEIVFSFLETIFWSNRIKQGFDFSILPLQQGSSEEETRIYIESQGVDVYYVDAILDFTDGFLESLQRSCKVVFYQNMSRAAPRANIFIYPSVRVNPEFFAQFDNRTAIYRGLEYVFFHPNIAFTPSKADISDTISTVAVSAGGSDPLDTLRHIYQIVSAGGFDRLKFIFFYGSDYAFMSQIPRDCPVNMEFRQFNHGSILKADVLITAFGVSTYEFLCLGMPIIAYGHQASNASALDELVQATRALISLGGIGNVNRGSLQWALEKLNRPEVRSRIARRAKHVIDMRGVDRVAAIIEASVNHH